MLADFQKAKQRLIFLDYDGTLVGFKNDPQKAKPTEDVLKELTRLTEDNRNTVVIISGRDKDTLDNWLGHLDLGLNMNGKEIISKT